jgi:hypothetical protein
MRAREFIFEAAREFSDKKSSTMVKTLAFPDMPSANPYKAYRFGMAMANHKIKHDSGPADQFAVILAYTPEEEEIIDQAAKNMGQRSVVIADRGSNEPQDTDNISPVAKPRRNRYGV